MMFWFFFFKQKTAYEMRISDWSSDVCSSDLQHLARLPKARELEIVAKIGLRACRPINVIDQLAEPVIGFAKKRHPFAGPNKSPSARRFELQHEHLHALSARPRNEIVGNQPANCTCCVPKLVFGIHSRDMLTIDDRKPHQQ